MDFNTAVFSQLMESILKKKPGGEVVIKEYSKIKSLTHVTRLISNLISEMTETVSLKEGFVMKIVEQYLLC